VTPVTSRTATGGSSDPPEHAANAAKAAMVRAVRRIDPSVWAIGHSEQADETQNFGS
jgi:hypothetical protein